MGLPAFGSTVYLELLFYVLHEVLLGLLHKCCSNF